MSNDDDETGEGTEATEARGLAPHGGDLARYVAQTAQAAVEGAQAGRAGYGILSNPYADAPGTAEPFAAWRIGWLSGTAERIETLPSVVGLTTGGGSTEQVQEARRGGYLAYVQGMAAREAPPFSALRLVNGWREGWLRAELGQDPPPGPPPTPEEARENVANVLARAKRDAERAGASLDPNSAPGGRGF